MARMLESNSAATQRYPVGDILKALVVLVCVTSYPTLYLFAHNVAIADLSELPILLGLSLTVFLVIAVICILLTRNLQVGTLIASAIALLFFSYGHVFILLSNSRNAVLRWLGSDLVLLPVAIGILLVIIVLSLKFKHYLQQAMPAMLVFGVILIAPLLYQIGSYIIRERQSDGSSSSDQIANVSASGAQVDSLPDVYYIILDGYSRADVLQANFHYDNGTFIQALEERGFYVASDSYSNYPQTYISLTSSLNMQYHDPDSLAQDDQGLEAEYRSMLADTEVVHVLVGDLGYEYYANKTKRGTTLPFPTGAPAFYETDFFYILMKSSLLGVKDRVLAGSGSEPVQDDDEEEPVEARERRQNLIQREMAALPQFVEDSAPSFVFAHFMSPHPPYKFTTSIYEGKASSLDSSPWLDHEAYVRETQAVSELVLQTIDEILAHSDTPPIIIIQGDHGAATKFYEDGLSWKVSAGTLGPQMPEDVRLERFAILNAYYVPPEIKAQLYPSISPVNSFRLILSYLTDQDYPLLPDRSFLATYEKPVEYIEFPELHDNVSP
jgi:hypothetical protein